MISRGRSAETLDNLIIMWIENRSSRYLGWQQSKHNSLDTCLSNAIE